MVGSLSKASDCGQGYGCIAEFGAGAEGWFEVQTELQYGECQGSVKRRLRVKHMLCTYAGPNGCYGTEQLLQFGYKIGEDGLSNRAVVPFEYGISNR